ncbi:MAG: hypothetical protein JSV96_13435 [Candidatus Aminicenantes bacterium]|nr:MAG: hypothetical protein JSV96_13435 [Candidatus Aminicenantes bacterium]
MKLKNIKNFRDILLIFDKAFYQLLMRSRTTFIMEKDWDNLIILDGCRYDMFKKNNSIPGKLEYIYSRGSSTGHFLAENFSAKYFPDTVYITANPLVNYYVEDSFYEVVPVWKDGWYEPYNTVLPGTMVDYAIRGNKEFPDKRLIIHFMQPHFPFIDKQMRRIIGEHEGILSRNLLYGKETKHTQKVWTLLQAGRIKRNTVWDAYNKNLIIVLEQVKNLLLELKGKTIISSDHANLFGEWLFPIPLKEYGHPGGLYKKDLIKVPWLIIEAVERKVIRKEGGIKKKSTAEKTEDEAIKEKLKALGYL